MYFKKMLLLLIPLFTLASCGIQIDVKPTSLKAKKDEISLILGSERNLNDIVTLIFEPNNVTNRDVIWSTQETEIFTLDGNVLTTKKVGTSNVKATSVIDANLFTTVNITVYNPETPTYKVLNEISEDYEILNLKDEYNEDDEVVFTINVINDNKKIKEVSADEQILSPVNEFTYKFIMPNKDVLLNVVLEDKNDPAPEIGSDQYKIVFDLEGGKRAKRIETADVLFNTFLYLGNNESIIESIGEFDYMYGGGYGGKGDTSWYSGDMLKLGTTSVNGYFTLNLSKYINKINIIGYTSSEAAKIRVGDANSSDWNDNSTISNTTLIECNELAFADKTNIENKVEATISLEFETTKNLKISTINNKPIYITAIELIYKD